MDPYGNIWYVLHWTQTPRSQRVDKESNSLLEECLFRPRTEDRLVLSMLWNACKIVYGMSLARSKGISTLRQAHSHVLIPHLSSRRWVRAEQSWVRRPVPSRAPSRSCAVKRHVGLPLAVERRREAPGSASAPGLEEAKSSKRMLGIPG